MPRLTELTVASVTPLTNDLALDSGKLIKQRRLPPSTSMATLLEVWTKGATGLFEEQSGHQVMRARAVLRADCFPCRDRFLELPLPPLVSVESITYATGGSPSLETLDPSVYDVQPSIGQSAPAAPGRIVLKGAMRWPSTERVEGAVTVTALIGYADATAKVPALVETALYYLVGSFHTFSDETIGGPHANSLTKIPIGAEFIMRAFRNRALRTQAPWEAPWRV